jgi:hypothetical protein
MSDLLNEVVGTHNVASRLHAISQEAKENLQSHDAAVLSIAMIRLDCEDPTEAIAAIEYGATSTTTAARLRVALDAAILEYALTMVTEPSDLPVAVDYVNLLGSSEEAKRMMRVAIAGHGRQIVLD